MRVNSLQKSSRILEWTVWAGVQTILRDRYVERPCHTQDQWSQAAKSRPRSGYSPEDTGRLLKAIT